MKIAIVLAAHGSRDPGSRPPLESFMQKASLAFPEAKVVEAYTSIRVRNHFKEIGQSVNSPAMVLDRLEKQGITHVVLQSLHIIPGKEYHQLLTLANEMTATGRFKCIEVGFPLLGGEQGLNEAATALINALPPREKENQALLLVGHGTRHVSNDFYLALDRKLRAIDSTVFVGAMSGEPKIPTVRRRLKESGITSVTIVPLLFGAGLHASTDIAGTAPDSWESELTADGLQCRTIVKGVGEYAPMAEIWMDNLKKAMRRLCS